MKKIYLFLLLIFVAFSCSKKNNVVKLSSKFTYAIEYKKERSYYQAKKIKDRLNDMDQKAYIAQYLDTMSNKNWFHILGQAYENSDTADNVALRLTQELDLIVNVIDYKDFDSSKFLIDSLNITEVERIKAEKPNVPDHILNTIKKFPESNSLFVNNTTIVNFETREKEPSAYQHFKTDLPRGIKISDLAKETKSYVETKYKDNLRGDIVTIGIIKLNEKAPVQTSGFINSKNKRSYEIAKKYADKILNSGEYKEKSLDEILLHAYNKLYGYRTTIQLSENRCKTYYVLVDELNQYLFLSESSEKTDSELSTLLEQIGKTNGLNNYNEFYNNFYTIPNTFVDKDFFVGFSLNKLGWSYAEAKNYSNWSMKMVGHWKASAFFTGEKGLYAYVLFDLLNNQNRKRIYNNLYAKNSSNARIDVCGQKAIVVQNFDWRNYNQGKTTEINFGKADWKNYNQGKVTEINFGKGRYAIAINNTVYSSYSLSNLVDRASLIQF